MDKQGIVSDLSEVSIPETAVPEEQLQTERNMAKFSKTKEYQVLKEYMETRIEFFQRFLPNGDAVATQKAEEVPYNWVNANIVIAEFKAVLDAYQRAQDVVNEPRRS